MCKLLLYAMSAINGLPVQASRMVNKGLADGWVKVRWR